MYEYESIPSIKQEAHGPNHSHENHIIEISKLQQNMETTLFIIFTWNKGVSLYLNKLTQGICRRGVLNFEMYFDYVTINYPLKRTWCFI